MKILHVVGARPNFMKAAPVWRAIAGDSFAEQVLVHTGQHYDDAMSNVFLRQLDLPAPAENLEVGSGSHAQQTATIVSRFEPVLAKHHPDLLMVYGDVNSTIAAALVAAKMNIKIAHVEAGLRSFDRTMPEEINRLLTDQLADLLFTPSLDGNENLAREGIPENKIHLVGNVMIDTLVRLLPFAEEVLPEDVPQDFVLVTLHRAANVDDPKWLQDAMMLLGEFAQKMPVLFPVHPRTRGRIDSLGIEKLQGLHLMEPVPYLEFLALQSHAQMVITDSGGIQEETSFLGIPCFTLRDNTERPITTTCGTNHLVGRDLARLREAALVYLDGKQARPARPQIPLWDGLASQRILEILHKVYP
jgi:UDP-N-acetylglucosamine 2-epimerase (non-hydrolysing)